MYCEAKANSERIIVDIGCGRGCLTRVLSLQFTTIGLDVDKSLKVQAQGGSKIPNFILADMHAMPFRRHSVDVVVCISLLEHCRSLEDSIRKIKAILKKDGVCVVGYPVETKFFKFIWRLVTPRGFKFIDQSQTFWLNPITHKQECYWESPHTHKQTYQTIRDVLRKHFKILQKERLLLNIFPDSLIYYECMKVGR